MDDIFCEIMGVHETDTNYMQKYNQSLPSMKCQLFHKVNEVGEFIDILKWAGSFTNMTYERGQLRADLVFMNTVAGRELRERFQEATPTVTIVRWGNSPYVARGYGFILP